MGELKPSAESYYSATTHYWRGGGPWEAEHTDSHTQTPEIKSSFAPGLKAWKQILRLSSLHIDIKLRPLNFQTSACFVHHSIDSDLIKPKSFDPPEQGNVPSWVAMSVFSEDGKHFA